METPEPNWTFLPQRNVLGKVMIGVRGIVDDFEGFPGYYGAFIWARLLLVT